MKVNVTAMKNFDFRKPQPDSPEVTVEKPSDLQFGGGATVSSTYVQERARALFADALFRLAPETTTNFITPEAVQLYRIAYATTTTGSDDDRRVAGSRLDEHITTWQEQYHLHDPWIKPKLLRSLMPAVVFPHWKGIRLPGPLSLSWHHVGAHGLDEEGVPFDAGWYLPRADGALGPTMHTLTVGDLVQSGPEEDGGIRDAGDIGSFDPRQQSVEDAMRALMPMLETRLRNRLELIVGEDLEQTYTTEPITFKKATPYEWLVRFQVLHESRASIARTIAKANGKDDPDLYRSYVGKEVRRVAGLIGLKLRDI